MNDYSKLSYEEALARIANFNTNNIVEALLNEVLPFILRLELLTMSALTDLQTSVSALTAQVALNTTAVDALLANPSSGGGAATVQQLIDLKTALDAQTAALAVEDAKISALIPSVPAPAPVPLPTVPAPTN